MLVSANNSALRPHVRLFTDGACSPNPGVGGWAYILKHPSTGASKEGSGGEHATTNNRMEIMAVIQGLEALKVPSTVDLYSDSEYVVKALTGWMETWKRFGWKRTKNAKTPVKNADLWQRLDAVRQIHIVGAKWVRGHVGHPENERCDQLAEAAVVRIAQTSPPPRQMSELPLDDIFASGQSADENKAG